VSGAVQEVRVAERDVRCAGLDLLANVLEDDVGRDRAESSCVDRHHGAVAAQVLASAARFGKPGDAFGSVRPHEVRVARKLRQPAAIGNDERHLFYADHGTDLRCVFAVRAQALGKRDERRLGFAAQDRADAERTQQDFVHRRVQTIGA